MFETIQTEANISATEYILKNSLAFFQNMPNHIQSGHDNYQ